MTKITSWIRQPREANQLIKPTTYKGPQARCKFLQGGQTRGSEKIVFAKDRPESSLACHVTTKVHESYEMTI